MTKYTWFDFMESVKVKVECNCNHCNDTKKAENPKKVAIADKYYDMVDRLTKTGTDYELAEVLAGMKYPLYTTPDHITCPHCSTGEEIKTEATDLEPVEEITADPKNTPSEDEDGSYTWFDFMAAVKK